MKIKSIKSGESKKETNLDIKFRDNPKNKKYSLKSYEILENILRELYKN